MKLHPFDISDFHTFYPLLKTSFPKEELLPQEIHLKLFSQPNFFGRQYQNFSSFIIGYQFDSYLFLELFMVQEHLRGKNIGTQFLKTIIEESSTPIILEVEHPINDISKRRIEFYKRLGFHLNISDYKMPQFDNNHGGVPLYLMSYPRQLTQEELSMYEKKIYQDVYLVDC